MITRSKEELLSALAELIETQTEEKNAELFSLVLKKKIKYLGDDDGFYKFSEEEHEWIRTGDMLYTKATYADPYNDGTILKSFKNETDQTLCVGETVYCDTIGYDSLLPTLIDPKHDLYPHYIEILSAGDFAKELLKLDEPSDENGKVQ